MWRRRETTGKNGDLPAEWGFHYALPLVERVAGMYEVSEFKATLTGSYLQDIEDYPDLVEDALFYLTLQQQQEKVVENTMALVRDPNA